MRRIILLGLVTVTAVLAVPFTPDSFGGPYCLSPAFGAAACALGNEYINGGVVFSQMGVGTAVFTDPPSAWGGINGSGIVDLLAPVSGAIVAIGTTDAGVADSISVEAGSSSPGSLLLEVFDVGGSLITSRVSGLDGVGPHGNFLINIAVPGIRFFQVSTPQQDTFGVDQIDIGAIQSLEAPEPTTGLLLGAGLVGLSLLRRRKA